MKYLILGTGGTGGAIGGYLARAGADVTFIARGAHLAAMQEAGLRFETPDASFTVPAKACTMDEYTDKPDVIFVCVKGYSLEESIPFLERITDEHTVVIPILNIYGTGGKLQEQLPHTNVTDGCIYIVSLIQKPGVIGILGDIFRVVYGLRRNTSADISARVMPVLKAVEQDLTSAGIHAVLSDNIEKDALKKFSLISAMAAVGAYYDVENGAVQVPGELRDTFVTLQEEMIALADAMEIGLPDDIIQTNLQLLDNMSPSATTSMHRDIRAGKQSEVDGLIFEVVRLGERYNVPVPTYKRISEKFEAIR